MNSMFVAHGNTCIYTLFCHQAIRLYGGGVGTKVSWWSQVPPCATDTLLQPHPLPDG